MVLDRNLRLRHQTNTLKYTWLDDVSVYLINWIDHLFIEAKSGLRMTLSYILPLLYCDSLYQH